MTCREGHSPKKDFEPGNQLSRTHGAYSVQAIADQAVLVHNELLRVAPWLDEERYAPSLLRYLQAAAREALAHRALTASGAKFSPRLLESCTAAARLAWQMGDELGLTPAGHARLKVLMADSITAEVSVAELAERGRQIRERRQAEFARDKGLAGPVSGAVDPDDAVAVPGVVDAGGPDEASEVA